MRILITDSKKGAVGLSLQRALSALGHRCDLLIDDDGLGHVLHSLLEVSPFRRQAMARRMFLKRGNGRRLKRLVKAEDVEMVIVIQGDYFLKSDIAAIRNEFNIPVVNWLVHDPVLSEFFDPMRLGELAEYSHLFIADEAWLPGVYFFGKPVTHLPLAGDPAVFKSLENTKKDIDIFFAGDLFPPSPGRTSGLVHARVLESLLVNGFRVHASVSGKASIQKFVPALKKLTVIRGPQTPEALNALYNRSKIVLTLFPLDYKKDAAENFFNAALAQAFQLVEQKRNIEKLFPKSAVIFRSQKELIELLHKYLKNDAARDASSAALHEEVRRAHTYWDWAQKILLHAGVKSI
jgi:spore maturation protein CgeB